MRVAAFAPALPLVLPHALRCPPPSSSPRRPRASVEDGDGGDFDVRGRRGGGRHYRGDDLPFDVRVISPPPRSLGRFRLHPRTQCGDVIELVSRGGEARLGRQADESASEGEGEGEGEEEEGQTEAYVVKRVRNRFVWSTQAGGKAGVRMSRKTLEIKSLARKSIESQLERTLRES